VQNVRHRHRTLRAKLQAKGTRGARRLLKKRRRKETRFQRHENHCISKEIVAKAIDTKRTIALEDLSGIRERIRSRKPQRAALSSWAFRQLRAFVTYKAQAAGVPLVIVDPRNTSRTCPACGHVDKTNRKSQASFLCTSCSLAGNADHFAALEIQRRGTLSCPHCSPGASGQAGQNPTGFSRGVA
jgi:putative transposase